MGSALLLQKRFGDFLSNIVGVGERNRHCVGFFVLSNQYHTLLTKEPTQPRLLER